MQTTQFNSSLVAVVIGLLLLGGAYYLKTMPEKNMGTDETKNALFVTLSPAEFAKQADKKEVTVIDIRTPEEVAEGKVVADALELDYYSPDFKSELAKLDKDQTYLIYCRSGNRTGDTKRMMKSLGFTDVSDLQGGKVAWEQSGRELVLPTDGDSPVPCPADAKLCADGTAVGRTGPNCEFPAC